MPNLFAPAVLILVPRLAMAQGAPGTNIIVDVGVTALSVRGDTAEVTYVLRNRPGSAEQLFQFTVDAPSSVLRISLPQPEHDWAANASYRGRSVARWAVLGEQMRPGEDSPPLVFSAVGLPAIVTYWVRGYVPPPPLTPADTLPVVPPSDPLVANSLPGRTVGIAPFPNDGSLSNLLAHLLTLTDESCGALGWITSTSVCSSLTAKLQQAGEALVQADNTKARTQLESFLAELAAQHGRAVCP